MARVTFTLWPIESYGEQKDAISLDIKKANSIRRKIMSEIKKAKMNLVAIEQVPRGGNGFQERYIYEN
jgi:DNA-directed RNA polymerase alpha subunit